ncbi:hypothetical protein LMH87_009506 [Akanthomyces muscarius]|uniref:alcohol dehydrogenase (NADP(+)) n=1 Tax=Akanthomyces muscarius TaxID=2231603 RepID=A0A9W8QD25_AKAMU|nr:hypothetical protein LMH87_009506 [Akanthomyces muscarius]KAJ4152992.1 hypothetical protein LMH87_009506 [Akanthomyces muscarius]
MATDYKFEGWLGEDAESVKGKMVWKEFEPKKWEENDVDIKITHSGICGSDLHTLRSGWGATPYPCVVGHEIVGTAVRVGSKAEGGIKVGDTVGVGAQADSCLGRGKKECAPCKENEEPYCVNGNVNTYGSIHYNGDKAYGGYALYHRAPSHFVVKIPDGLAPEYAAPMLCGGVTVYSPLKHWGVGPGKKVGIAGVGGLGHFAVIFAKAMGADEVVGISRKASKRDEAMALGCDDYIATEDDKEWSKHNARRFDVIISTVSSAKMPIADYIQTLALDGSMIQVGAPEEPIPLPIFPLITGRRSLAGSAIGSPKTIREMLEFAAKHKVKPFVEKRPMSDANQAVVDMEAGKARFRYVLVNENH